MPPLHVEDSHLYRQHCTASKMWHPEGRQRQAEVQPWQEDLLTEKEPACCPVSVKTAPQPIKSQACPAAVPDRQPTKASNHSLELHVLTLC